MESSFEERKIFENKIFLKGNGYI